VTHIVTKQKNGDINRHGLCSVPDKSFCCAQNPLHTLSRNFAEDGKVANL